MTTGGRLRWMAQGPRSLGSGKGGVEPAGEVR
jgi:hypothetical protein